MAFSSVFFLAFLHCISLFGDGIMWYYVVLLSSFGNIFILFIFPYSVSGNISYNRGWISDTLAIQFSFSESYVSVPAVSLNGVNFTVACWVNPTGTNETGKRVIYSSWARPGQFMFGLLDKENNPFFTANLSNENTTQTVVANVSVPLNCWTHVAVTVNETSGEISFYINASKISGGWITQGGNFVETNPQTHEIGNSGALAHQFLGSLMDLYVVGDVLPGDEINFLRGSS